MKRRAVNPPREFGQAEFLREALRQGELRGQDRLPMRFCGIPAPSRQSDTSRAIGLMHGGGEQVEREFVRCERVVRPGAQPLPQTLVEQMERLAAESVGEFKRSLRRFLQARLAGGDHFLHKPGRDVKHRAVIAAIGRVRDAIGLVLVEEQGVVRSATTSVRPSRRANTPARMKTSWCEVEVSSAPQPCRCARHWQSRTVTVGLA